MIEGLEKVPTPSNLALRGTKEIASKFNNY
jgi:hypothetical protein